MHTVGIIGFGSFGAFMAEKLEPHVRVLVSSRRPEAVPEKWRARLEDVVACEYIILSIPLDSYPAVLRTIAPLLQPETVLVDVCSVKLRPVEIIRNVLPDTKLVATHPLFGPESAADSLEGHPFVLCRDVSDPDAAHTIAGFAKSLGLIVIDVTADAHDRQMAIVHGLTFFIAQGLVNIGIEDVTLHTPSFKRLLNVADLERHHSPDLFRTIQSGNPYASAIRSRILTELASIDKELD